MWMDFTSSSNSGGFRMNQRTFSFATYQKISMLCECGLMPGKINLHTWGIKINFHCKDCGTSCAMEVKE